jgi:excisionase family DNA binding protein
MSDTTTWFTPKQAAEHAKVNPITLRRAVKAGTLPAYRVNGGRLLRFRAEDINQWLAASPVVEKRLDARAEASGAAPQVPPTQAPRGDAPDASRRPGVGVRVLSAGTSQADVRKLR